MKLSEYEHADPSTLGRKDAIRAKCMDCVCYQEGEVWNCPVKDCPLWYWRRGYRVDRNDERVIKE